MDHLKPAAWCAVPPAVLCFLLTCSPFPPPTMTSLPSSPSVSVPPWKSRRGKSFKRREMKRGRRRRRRLNPERFSPMWRAPRSAAPGSSTRNFLAAFWDFQTFLLMDSKSFILVSVWLVLMRSLKSPSGIDDLCKVLLVYKLPVVSGISLLILKISMISYFPLASRFRTMSAIHIQCLKLL